MENLAVTGIRSPDGPVLSITSPTGLILAILRDIVVAKGHFLLKLIFVSFTWELIQIK